jgi:hypothetical protein
MNGVNGVVKRMVQDNEQQKSKASVHCVPVCVCVCMRVHVCWLVKLINEGEKACGLVACHQWRGTLYSFSDA